MAWVRRELSRWAVAMERETQRRAARVRQLAAGGTTGELSSSSHMHHGPYHPDENDTYDTATH